MPPADQWVIFNVQETGYYKVNYDEQNWVMITSQLASDHRAIHTINRAQVRRAPQANLVLTRAATDSCRAAAVC